MLEERRETMARVTIFFGIVLILLGLLTFMATGSKAPTSLIPTGFGILLVLFGWLGRTTDLKKRALWMHIAAPLGCLDASPPSRGGRSASSVWSRAFSIRGRSPLRKPRRCVY